MYELWFSIYSCRIVPKLLPADAKKEAPPIFISICIWILVFSVYFTLPAWASRIIMRLVGASNAKKMWHLHAFAAFAESSQRVISLEWGRAFVWFLGVRIRMILGPNSRNFASLTKVLFTVNRDRSEAENQCFCKSLTTMSKIVIFHDFCRVGIERNPRKSTKSRFFAHFGSRFEAS